MIQIGDTIVSLDVIEKFFCCDLDVCHGQCCVEGDAGAPVTPEEVEVLRHHWHNAKCYMDIKAINEININDVAYTDTDGDLVTTIINGRDCAFTCYENGCCLCSLEKAHYDKGLANIKPVSCSLYPIRLTEYPTFTAINLHIWDVCKSAFIKGKKENIRVFEFLKNPLIKRFGSEWYDELQLTAEIYLQEKDKK